MKIASQCEYEKRNEKKNEKFFFLKVEVVMQDTKVCVLCIMRKYIVHEMTCNGKSIYYKCEFWKLLNNAM